MNYESLMTEISIREIPGIGIGQDENAQAGTGCTVLVAKDGMRAGLDVRGGGPASRESQLLNPLMSAQAIHAIVLAGGSAFGLGTADGVMKLLEERGIGFDVGVTKVPLVAQTVLSGRTRPWAMRPQDMRWMTPTTATATTARAAAPPSARSRGWTPA